MLGIVALAILAPAEASTAGVIEVIGSDHLMINHEISSTFHFTHDILHIGSGGTVTFVNETPEPHTISIVNQADLPTNVSGVFGCGAPGTVCFNILGTHAPNGINPATGQPNPPFYPFVTVPGNPSGFTMNNVQGNSIAIFPGQTLQVIISAPSGTVLHYMCAIHPWMQGTIYVQ